MQGQVEKYFVTLAKLIASVEISDDCGRDLTIDQGSDCVRRWAHLAHDSGKKLIFIGNGGSAALASHLAIDFCKNGGLRALALNDPSALTCLGNDLGYENVFAQQIIFHAQAGDLLVAISSSGRSPNILAAVSAARQRDCRVVTFSGFGETNELRSSGDVNFYIRSREYGFVEVAHLSVCHAILDVDMGWGASAPAMILAEVE
ncbi:MAG: D-sedoheptulose 7-phosphate isomerase [Aliidongia sp.]|jgi:D-sedoheptulose 7-phosphate isomerase|nr:D-sedoheptulose 7-phosphate isomerase [Aliidongia sp.]